MGYQYECAVDDRPAKDGTVTVYDGEVAILTFDGGAAAAWDPPDHQNRTAMEGAKAAFREALADGPQDSRPQA